MNKNKKLILLMITLTNAWSLLVPFYGSVLDKMVLRSGSNLDTAKTACVTVYMVSLFIFMFAINKKTARRFLSIGLITLIPINLLMWFVPQTQNIFTFSLLGFLSGMVKAPIFYVFIYGFNSQNRERAVGIFLFGTYFIAYIYKLISLIINENIIFVATTLLLAAAGVISFLFKKDEIISQSSISKRSFPVKMTLILGTLYLIAFFCNGVLINTVYPRLAVEAKGAMFYLELLPQLIIFLTVAVLGNRVNLFTLLNMSIAFMGAACLFFIILGGNIATNVVIDTSYSLFDVFMYSIWGDISLKYGRSSKVGSTVLLYTFAGTAIGEFASKKVIEYSENTTGAIPITILSALFICVFITPWLIKCIGDSLSNTLNYTVIRYGEDNYVASQIQDQSEPQVSIANEVFSENSIADTEALNTTVNLSDKLMEEIIEANKKLDEVSKLTPREMDIAVYLLQRYDYNTIANELFISVNTLKVHVKHIYQKMQVSSKNELITAVDQLLKHDCTA